MTAKPGTVCPDCRHTESRALQPTDLHVLEGATFAESGAFEFYQDRLVVCCGCNRCRHWTNWKTPAQLDQINRRVKQWIELCDAGVPVDLWP
jgi:CO dehydrogenase/acetyl-CoA synthase alpha subunit